MLIAFPYFSFSEPMVAYQGEEVILPSSQPEYFQGEELPRTSSPFGEYNSTTGTYLSRFYLNGDSSRGGGVLPKKMDRGVRPASQNPYPIYDLAKNLIPYL